MNLFLYMPIISPSREFINVDSFFSGSSRACLQSMTMFKESLHPARVDTKWLVYYRSRWPDCMGICFHVVVVAEVRSGWASWHAEWRHGRGIWGGEAACGHRYASWDGSTVNRGNYVVVGWWMNLLILPFCFYKASVPPRWLPVLSTYAYCHSNARPGWKQPPLREEFSLSGWGVLISCFL